VPGGARHSSCTMRPMYERKVLGHAEARAALDAVLAAAEGGQPVVVAVVDPDGEAIALLRMDGAGFLARHMALRKAYTAARMGADTHVWAEGLRKGGIGLSDLGDPQLVGFGGGVCVRFDGAVVGAVGVSGRSAEDDAVLARAGEAAIQRSLGA